MKAPRLFALFVAPTLLNLAAGLQCYTCIASTTSDCYRGVEPSYLHQQCEPVSYNNFSLIPELPLLVKNDIGEEPIKTVCVRLEYSDISETFIRGCGYIYESVDICEYLEEFIDVKGCSSCDHDMCNDRPAPI